MVNDLDFQSRMDHLIYCRIFGYITTICVHVVNGLYMLYCLQGDVMEDPLVRRYASAQTRLFTVWTFILQLLFASLALVCDYLVLRNNHRGYYKLPKHLQDARDALFGGILWPSSWIVFSFFWTLFLYDRDLILPDYVDKFLTRTSNHIIHTFIVPVVMWEVMFRPKEEPRSHKKNLVYMACVFVFYICVMVFTYYEKHFWIYPIMGELYGTIYFPLLMLMLGAISMYFYYMQWWIRRIIWGKVENVKTSDVSKKIR